VISQPARNLLTIYSLQQPLVQVAGLSVGLVATLSVQQPAKQPVAPSAQQSHWQSSQEQTPVSQQQPPSGQQVSQAQTFDSAFKIDLHA
jgi:hypothetical protein